MVVSGSGQATPRTADGHPDLQGIGDNSTLTPLERPPALAGQALFSPEDAADYERPERFVERAQARNGDDEAATTGEVNKFWRGPRTLSTDLRTSLILDPPNGRMTRTDDRLYEYACHKGNYAMPGILRGARFGEKDR